MNIVFAVPSMGFGGAERVVSILANEFSKQHNVSIVLLSGKEEIAYKLEQKVNTVIIPQNLTVLKRWKQFRCVCKQLKADVVLAFMTGVGVMATGFLVGTSIPVIISERCDPYAKDMQLSAKLRIINFFTKFLTKGYVFQSEGAKNFYPKVVQKKSCIILNPLNTENFPVYNIDNAEKRIVSVGRLHEQKNQKLLINAFAKSKYCNDYALHIYGEGKLRDELQVQIDSLGLQEKVVLEGNRSNVLQELIKAKLFVFTSNYEGLPNALIEAMALGLPCVSTDCSPGGARMLINNGENGLLVPCNDLSSLVDAMNKLYDDSDFCKKVGEKAKLIREKTKTDAIAKEWLDFIERCKKKKDV